MKTLEIKSTDGTHLMTLNILTTKEKHGDGLLCKVAGDGKIEKHCEVVMDTKNYTDFSALWGLDIDFEADLKNSTEEELKTELKERFGYDAALQDISDRNDLELRKQAMRMAIRDNISTKTRNNDTLIKAAGAIYGYLKNGEVPG